MAYWAERGVCRVYIILVFYYYRAYIFAMVSSNSSRVAYYLIETFAWNFDGQHYTGLAVDGSCQNTHFSIQCAPFHHLLMSRSMHPCQLVSDHSANCSPFPAPGHTCNHWGVSSGRSTVTVTRAGHTEGTGDRHGSRHNAISQADAHSAAGIRYHLRSRSTLSCLVNHLRRSLRKQAVPRAGIEYNNAPVYSAATVALRRTNNCRIVSIWWSTLAWSFTWRIDHIECLRFDQDALGQELINQT